MDSNFQTITIEWDRQAGAVISRLQIPFYPVDSIKQSMIAYDSKTGKFSCDYTADDVFDRRRYKLYAPESDSYRKYFSSCTQQYIDLLNERQELPLPVLVMGLNIRIEQNMFEQLLAEGYFPELTRRM